MPATVNKLIEIKESELLEKIVSFKEIDEADIVTAYADGRGTFTVESTVIVAEQPAALPGTSITLNGKMSEFGGPDDTVVQPDEGLALFSAADVGTRPDLFLPQQPPNTTGVARRLDPDANYIACRWDYGVTPKHFLRGIKVRVVNPADNTFADAQPVDFGPNLSTGRVADLSPGLAALLGLKTDDLCQVVIPPPQVGVATGVDIAAVDKVVFPPDMTRALIAMTTSNNSTYWITNQIGNIEGGQTLMRKVGPNAPEVVLNDSAVLPVQITDLVPALVADELNKAAPRERAIARPRPDPASPGDATAKIFAKAVAFVGHDTSNVPFTDHGNLACAWAVNEVVRLALGKAITTDSRGKNGLGTDGLFDALRAKHKQIDVPTPGAIIISPTPPRGSVHGHVGIVGQNPNGETGGTQIFSNSSSQRQFAQNRTIASWKARYVTQLHLQMLYFEVDASQL